MAGILKKKSFKAGSSFKIMCIHFIEHFLGSLDKETQVCFISSKKGQFVLIIFYSDHEF